MPDAAVSRRRAPLPGTLGFFVSELRLVLGRRRNQAGLLVLAAVPVLIAVAIRLNNGPRHGGDGGGPNFFSAITGNGLFVGFAALTVELGLFLPLAIAMLSGDAIAGEANGGTLRYLLTVPVGRVRLLAVKYAGIVSGALIGAFLVAGTGGLVGSLVFGTGPVTTLSGTQLTLAEAVGRLAVSALYAAAGLAALGAVGLFISTLTEQPIAAMVATVGFSTISWILDSIPQLDAIHPWLLVHRWLTFSDLLRDPPMLDNLMAGLGVDLAYTVVFLLAAWARFAGKDVTS